MSDTNGTDDFWATDYSYLNTSISVQARDSRTGMKWAVIDGGQCLSRSGAWDYEPLPSSRTDEWLAEHRFLTLDEAFDACRKASADDLLAEWERKA